MQLALRSSVEALRLVWLLFWAWSGNTLSEARMSSLGVMPQAVVPPVASARVHRRPHLGPLLLLHEGLNAW